MSNSVRSAFVFVLYSALLFTSGRSPFTKTMANCVDFNCIEEACGPKVDAIQLLQPALSGVPDKRGRSNNSSRPMTVTVC